MLNELSINILDYLLTVAKGESINKQLEIEYSEEELSMIISYALQLFDPSSQKFQDIAELLNIQQYCSINSLILLKQLQETNGMTETQEVIEKIVQETIPGIIFKKHIYTTVTERILRLRLLGSYKEYVEETIRLLKDKTIKNITIF